MSANPKFDGKTTEQDPELALLSRRLDELDAVWGAKVKQAKLSHGRSKRNEIHPTSKGVGAPDPSGYSFDCQCSVS